MEHPLTAFRSAKGWKQPELARRLKVNKTTVWRWERGDVLIPVEKFDLIEQVTGIPRTDLRPDIFSTGKGAT